MSKLPAPESPRLPALFKPEETKRRDAKADAVIAYAKRVKDWPLLEEAVKVKLDEQEQFVAWWRTAVTPRQSPGRGGSKSIADRRLISVRDAEQKYGVRDDTVSRWSAALEDREGYEARIIGPARQHAGIDPADNHRAEGTGENEWYTPAIYLQAARDVMGGIDLDPATSEHGQKTVQAAHYFTRADDGLAQEWHGRVWLNPPYSQPDIGAFIAKWGREIGACHVRESIVLTHNYTDTAWFHQAEAIAGRICFTRGRVPFIDGRGQPCAPTQGQAFFYVGPSAERFSEIFGRFGFIR